MWKSFIYLWLSAISFLLTIVVVVATYPHYIYSHEGISLYGNLGATRIPFGVGLSMTAYFMLRACFSMSTSKLQIARSFRVGLEAIAIGLLGIVATPSWSSLWLIQNFHVLFGLVIFITQLALSVHYLIHVRGDSLDYVLLIGQIVAIVLVGLSFDAIGVLHIMLPAQILAITAFGALLIRAASYHINHNGRLETTR